MDASDLTDEMAEWQLTNELMESASLGDLRRVQELVEMGVAFAGISEGQWQSPLYRAVGGGHVDVVEYLVEIGADVNAADVYTQASPLMSAVEASNNRLVKFLTDHGADVNAVTSAGQSALIIASEKGLLDVVQCLVEHGADCNGATVFGHTALMQAATSGVLAVVQVLLDNGARINDITAQGTALSIAASASSEDIVRLLIDRGADVFACSPLLHAASSGRLDIMQCLIDAGVDMKISNEDGYTALFCATSGRRLNVVRYLLDHGANINAKATSDKRTALYEAAQGGNLDVVRLLCENGADLNATDRFEWTPLMVAAANSHIDVVKYLVECGADLNAESDLKWNVLACATASRNFDIVKYLVEVGTDVDAADSDGWTALMHASSIGQTDVVEFLASRVSDIETVNSAGHTAMDIATETDHLDAQRVLMRYTPSGQNKLSATIGIRATSRSLASPWFISPFDVRIKKFVQTGHVGGEFIVKWLDADAVIKLFVPTIANGDFKTELTTWHKLRHPNVIKLYGACDVVYNFFVCEYASNGSVVDYLGVHEPVRQTPWKFLHQAAMGLAYLHERKIVHGNLRGSNILVGSDGLAKLADFGLSGTVGRELDVSSQGSSVSSTRWQPPEQIRGGKPSTASDMYSFGLCIGEVLTLTIPWGKECTYPDESKQQWDLRETSQLNPMPPFFFWEDSPSRKAEDFIELLCSCDPTKRATVIACLPILESLATEEQSQLIACDEMQQPEAEPIISVYEFQDGELMKVWTDIQVLAQNEDLREIHKQLYQDFNLIMQKLVESSHSYKLLAQTSELLTNIRRAIQPGSHIAQVLQLSSSRVTGSSMFALQRHIEGIKNQIGLPTINADIQLTQQKLDHSAKQLELFVSETSKTWMVLNELVTQEDRQAFLLFLQSEMGNREGQYTDGQLDTMQQAYSEIKDSISNNSEGNPQFDSTLPEWFVPWYELPATEWKTLGQGGFAQVFRAKWLDSDVVVKRIEYGSESASSASTEREDARKMFMREVDIWFRLSHPNVVRLFGACHIGKPFFVCEFAEFGSLDEYLVSHQKELWQKLLEAALGILYLHERGIVHCDLKCNNIVVGSDCKAKVTDFGLSSSTTTDAVGDGSGPITGAWHWVAPELLMQEHAPPTFSSDVYAFGMCIIEAVKVIEASEDHSGNPPSTLPWSIRSTTLPNAAVKAHKKRGKLPSRPKFMSDLQWELIEKMCRFNANERVQMCTVVEELSVFAQQEGRGEHSVGTNMKAGEVSRDKITEETGGDSRSVMASMMALVNRYKSSSIGDPKLKSPRIVLYDIHELLWKRLNDVYKRVKDNAKALARLDSLIGKSQAVTIILETYADTLVESTKVALDSFALHRELDKLMAAEFISLDNQDEGVHKWRQACYHLLGVSETS